MAVEDVHVEERETQQIEVIRPKRQVVTREEAIRRMEAFPGERKEKLIAAVRKGKNRDLSP